jgi:hypothetical protein
MSDRHRRLPLAGLVPAVGVVVLVVAVGGVAVYAESQRDWGSYFLMEQAMAVGATAVGPLLALALAGGFALVMIAPRFEE